jgi:alpha-tubulin suppressor-like RCC1 family protein
LVLKLRFLLALTAILGTSIPVSAHTIAAGEKHTLVAGANGTLWVFGANDHGQLGLGDRTGRPIPTQVPSLVGVQEVAAGGGHSLALTSGGSVWSWGDNSNGQLGLGDDVTRVTPVRLPGLTGIVGIAVGESHSLAWRADGALYVWGANQDGQLGLGDTVDRKTPTRLERTSVASAAAGRDFTLILTAEGRVEAFGATGMGSLAWVRAEERAAPPPSLLACPRSRGSRPADCARPH